MDLSEDRHERHEKINCKIIMVMQELAHFAENRVLNSKAIFLTARYLDNKTSQF